MIRYILVFGILLLPSLAGELASSERPNILWLSCEDISPHLGCYGDPRANTPNLDRLAGEGVRFTHAFTAAGVCAPNRSTIITGMYQTTLGTHHMRSRATLPDHIKPFTVPLRNAGYYCTNNSKKDYQFRDPPETWDASSGKAHWRNRKKGQPFFAVFNFTGCHESGIASESKYRSVTKNLSTRERQDPARLTLPPYYPDTPVTREDWKRNYELITAMDAWAGEHIAALERAGLLENTIIFFWSDHGVGLPRAKRWLYDSGTHVPLIVQIPEKFREKGQGAPGTVDRQLVSSLDLGPTVLNLAGVTIPAHIQGRAFLGKELTAPREYVFGARDRMDERYDIIRSVRSPRYRYIRNYEPYKPYYQYMNTPEKGATMRELRRVHALGKLPAAAALFMAGKKPVEELYDLERDPHEVRNLAADPAHGAVLERLRAVHTRWIFETGDLGLIPEAEIAVREAKLGSCHAILRQPGSEKLLRHLGEVAQLAGDADSGNMPALLEATRDADAAVRYWGATGIGNLGKRAVSAGGRMLELLADASPNVRVAAARALCHMEKPDRALPLLIAELESGHQWGRLHAAIVLDEIDSAARPAIDALRKCLSGQPNKYITRVANRALNELLGTRNTVR